jgi:hypothetical protein
MPARTAKAVRWCVPSVVVAIGLGACGGGPSTEKTITEGDAICRDANRPIASTQTPGNYSQLSEAAGALATATDDQVTRLGELDLPGDDKAQVRAVISALRGVSRAAVQLDESADRSDDRATAANATKVSTSAKDAADRARAYGFTVCGVSTEKAANVVFDGARARVKAAFVSNANVTCEEASDEVLELREPTDLRSLARFMDAVLPIAERVDEKLRALAVPPGDEQVVKELVDAQGAATAKAREMAAAAKANNARLTEALTEELDVLQTAANAKADAYGIQACGTGTLS